MFPSKPRFLPLLGHCSQQSATEGPRSGGTAGRDGSRWPVGTQWPLMGFGVSPPHGSETLSPIAQLWVFITRVFLLQLFIFQLVSRSPSCRQSITVTSSARQQPNVTAPAPAAHPAFSGKGSTVGPPGCTHAGALSARGWKAQVTSPTQWTTYGLVFQAQNQPTVETLKPAALISVRTEGRTSLKPPAKGLEPDG